MNIKGKLKIVTGPHPIIRLEVGSTVVWLGTVDEWSQAIARPDHDNDQPSGKRLEQWMELAE